MINKDYYVGLDIGTDSIGWAVTDENYNILKSHGKAMWGIHLFDSGKTAADRRIHRTARRRTDRANQRMQLLNELFAEEIVKVDPEFLLRLSESKFFADDKEVAGKYTLFFDDDYCDVDYHKQYPTIYHLRSELIHNPNKHDIRLVYLAVAHIIKKRGHFLFEGQDIGTATNFSVVYEEFKQTLSDYAIEFSLSDSSDLEKILKNKTATVNDKKRAIKAMVSSDNPQTEAVCTLLAGGTVELSKLFDDETLSEVEVSKISFKSGFDDKADELESILGENFYLVEKTKAIYDWSVLVGILNGKEYISDSKIDVYNKHKSDLKILKALIKKYIPDKYKEVFSENHNAKIANYIAYTGHVSGKSKYADSYNCTQEDFCKYLRSILPKDFEPETDDEKYIINEITNNTVLPKQVIKDNSVIPYQLNKRELTIILENAARYYDFLNKTEDGLSVKEKIEKILTFKIPYYVGPLIGEEHSKNSWIVRKEPGKIYPWNFDEKVDKTSSAKAFIKRMTNKCTYLVGEDVLPKESILYSKFVIYNQLNNIRVAGEKLDVEVKNRLFRDKFLNVEKASNKLSKKAILNYLAQINYCSKDDDISGIDDAVIGSMKAYIKFKTILGEGFDFKMAEDIVAKITVLGESKDLLKWYLNNNYGENLSEEQINQILRLNFTGWGNLSEKFLTEIFHVNPATGECMSIMTGLENTQNNLMQLLSNEFDYLEKINEFNAGKNDIKGTITYKNVEELYVSPAVRRSIWRTSLIVKELVKVMGHDPKKIFIEMARDNTGSEKGKRKVSRKSNLLDLYKVCKEDCSKYEASLEKLDDNQLRRDKLFLYYCQLGKCMYSGEEIDLDSLDLYDIDHIYPQSKTKDDSIDNRVLVKRQLNADKGDKYPLPVSYRSEKTKALWKVLLDSKLITKEKYNRLMRTEAFSNTELAGFISRQIVETRQSTKAVADLLNRAYENTKIVYVKAGNVSNFRQQFEIVKCRSINDYHHAKDAYLNIVVGNVFDTKFGINALKFIQEGNQYSLNKLYEYDVTRGNTVAWKKEESIKTVKKNVCKNNILYTRYATEQKGGFFDQMPVAHGGGQFPLKTSDTRFSNHERYGGYNKVAGAYFVLVKHTDKKGKEIKTFEAVPIWLANKAVEDADAVKDYLINSLELNNPQIILPKVKYGTLFEFDNFRVHLTGRANGGKILLLRCGEQLVLSDMHYEYYKRIDKYIEDRKENKNITISERSGITKDLNIDLFNAFKEKVLNTKYKTRLSSQRKTFEDGEELFIDLSIEDQCVALGNILTLFKCVPGSTDLKLIGGSPNAGTYTINSNISDLKNAYIVNQSITGLFENKIDLSTL